MTRKNGSYSRFPAQRLAADAVLIALYFGLSLLAVQIGGIKITFSSLPTMIGAMLFGPVDGLIVGFLGAMMEQLLKFGFTATTLLWVLPPAVRGLFIGLCARQLQGAWTVRRPYGYFAVCVVSGLIVSVLNTLVFYVDAKLYHYYSYALIFGVFWLRIGSGALSSLLMSAVSLPVIRALKKTKLAPVSEGEA